MVNKDKIIRRAVPADAKLISDLSGVTFQQTFEGTCSDEDLAGFIEESYNENQILLELNDENDLYFIASVDTNPVGYLKMKEDESEVPAIKEHKSLEIKRAIVLGQALPGVPVWKAGDESKFPDLNYIIFPGNVGDDDSLLIYSNGITPSAGIIFKRYNK